MSKSQFISSETAFKITKVLAGLTNVGNFDFRFLPNVYFFFQDLDKIGEPNLTEKEYKTMAGGERTVDNLVFLPQFSFIQYYLESLYEFLLRHYSKGDGQYIDPSSQDSAVTLKIYDILIWIIHRMHKLFICVNFNFSSSDWKDFHEVCQPAICPTVYNCLQAIAYRNERIQRLLWKNKEFLVLEEMGLRKQYGELDLICMILDNDKLLLKSIDLDNLTAKVINRMSKDNFDVVLEILAKLSKATMNESISAVAMDIINGGPISEHMTKFEDLSVRNFNSLCIILNNLLKTKRTIILRNTLAKRLTFKLLADRVDDIGYHFVDKLLSNDRFNEDSKMKENKDPDQTKNYTRAVANFRGREYPFLHSNFQTDITLTRDEIVMEAEKYFNSIFDLYQFLHFSIFVSQVDQNAQLSDLNDKCLKPMREFLHQRGNDRLSYAQGLLSLNLPKLLRYMEAYIDVVNEKALVNKSYLASLSIMPKLNQALKL